MKRPTSLALAAICLVAPIAALAEGGSRAAAVISAADARLACSIRAGAALKAGEVAGAAATAAAGCTMGCLSSRIPGLLRMRGGGQKSREREGRERRHKEQEAAGMGAGVHGEDVFDDIGGAVDEEEARAFADQKQQLDDLHRKAVSLMDGVQNKKGGGGGGGGQQWEDIEEEYDEDERFSYQKQAELEMRRAEKAEAERQLMHEEYMERKRRGEIVSSEEVRDTLRWGDGEAQGADNGASISDLDADMPVSDWLQRQGLESYIPLFEEEGWDTIGAVMSMSERDLADMGIKKGHVRRIMLALKPPAQSTRIGSTSYRRRNHPDDDIDIKPYAMDSISHERPVESTKKPPSRAAFFDEPVHTSVRTRFGPGGASSLGDAGGLGAFLCGGGDEDEEEEEVYIPRHRKIQQQKDDIVERLKKGGR